MRAHRQAKLRQQSTEQNVAQLCPLTNLGHGVRKVESVWHDVVLSQQLCPSEDTPARAEARDALQPAEQSRQAAKRSEIRVRSLVAPSGTDDSNLRNALHALALQYDDAFVRRALDIVSAKEEFASEAQEMQ